MVVKFSVSGYKSIKDKISIDFLALKGSRIAGTRYKDNFNNRTAKSIVLFGANSSGKTSIIESLEICLGIITKKYLNLNLNSLIGEDFDKDIEEIQNRYSRGIEFSIETIHANYNFKYCISFDIRRITKEEFICNDEVIFTFINSNFKSKKYDYLSKIIPGDITSPTIHKIADNIKEINVFIQSCKNYYYIKNILEFTDKEKKSTLDKREQETLENNKNLALDILKILDNSIDDFKIFQVDNNLYKIVIIREDLEIESFYESSGIRKIIRVLPYFILSLRDKGIMLLDELDSSINTISLIRILNGIINSEDNIGAQFLLSSHNPLIFDTDMLHPSQIYVASKEDRITKLNRLSEYELRADKRKAYLNLLRGDYE